MNVKRKLAELERRVRELETRPVTYPPVVISLAPPAASGPLWQGIVCEPRWQVAGAMQSRGLACPPEPVAN